MRKRGGLCLLNFQAFKKIKKGKPWKLESHLEKNCASVLEIAGSVANQAASRSSAAPTWPRLDFPWVFNQLQLYAALEYPPPT